MSKEIKFRGVSLDTGKWEYGYLVMNPSKDYANIVNKKGINEMQMNAVDPQTVGEFTGLMDGDGNFLWEGDTIKNPSRNGGNPHIIKWSERYGAWVGDYGIEYLIAQELHEVTKVGNTFQIPNILGTDK